MRLQSQNTDLMIDQAYPNHTFEVIHPIYFADFICEGMQIRMHVLTSELSTYCVAGLLFGSGIEFCFDREQKNYTTEVY